MSSARRVIDWHQQDVGALARALGDLPDGRYVLVPENELEDDALELSEPQIAGLIDAQEQAQRGEARPLAEVHAWLATKYGALADASAKR